MRRTGTTGEFEHQRREGRLNRRVSLAGIAVNAVVVLAAAFIGAFATAHNTTIIKVLGGKPVRAAPATSSGPSNPELPPGVTVRRTTGSVPIKLSVGYGVDLDDNSSPNWSVKAGPAGSSAGYGSDIVFESTTGLGGDGLEFDQDAAPETGKVGYATCAEETAYSSSSVALGDLESDWRAGKKLCVRTTDSRYALITFISVSATELVVAATVWDPPFASP
jgi:hypothetical protein